MRRLVLVAVLLAASAGIAALVAVTALNAGGASAAPQVRLARVASGFDSPVALAVPRSEPGRLYVVEQAGRIIVVAGGHRRVFLDIRRSVVSGGEQGLLSVAFDPNYRRNHRFYVDYTDRNGDTRVVQYRSNGRRGLPGTARRLLFVNQPFANHNGGQLAFGPDGWLYVGMGDGGSENDPENRGQNLQTRLAKLLRINVNARPARVETAAYGLRNPWRFSFDRATGDLWIGDVGQNRWEEVDYTPRRSPGLENYGWSIYEGRSAFKGGDPNPAGKLVAPIAVYSHAGGNCTVIGGFVYRGRTLPSMRSRYFYGDWCTGIIWSLVQRNGQATSTRREPFRVPELTSFGEGARGELYAVSRGGSLYRLARG